MNPHQRHQLEERLKALPKPEQDRLFRRAAELRREDQKRRGRERKRFEDLDAPRPGSTRKATTDPVRLYVLKLLAREVAESGPERERPSEDQHDGSGSPERERRVADGDSDAEAPRSRSGLVDGGSTGSGAVPVRVATGVAVEVGNRRCTVRPLGGAGDGSDDVACRLPSELTGRGAVLCVGDRVAFTMPEDVRRERPLVTHVLPRRTVLTRRDPISRQRQAIGANVDAVVIVVSVVSPPLHPRLIDRYLIATEDSWVEQHTGRHADDPDPAQAIIAVNKIDLLDGVSAGERAAELARLEPYRALGVPIVECCASDGRGIDELRALVAGKTIVFVGHSGVGKSSLTNALDPSLGVRVGEVGEAANRGRHTTTSAQLHEVRPQAESVAASTLPPSPPRGEGGPAQPGRVRGASVERAEGSEGSEDPSPRPLEPVESRAPAREDPSPRPLPGGVREQGTELAPAPGAFWVIDTPGVRSFGLDDLTPAELRDSMPEIRRLRQGCRFNDCTHVHEPGCAVRTAVASRSLHPDRYETYLRLLEELEHGPKGPPAERIRPNAPDPSPGDRKEPRA